MKAWLISVSVTCLLLILMELMLSDGETKKYIKGIIRLIIVIIILSPIVNFIKNPIAINKIPINMEADINYDYNDYNKFIKEYGESRIEEKLKKIGVECDVDIYLSNDTIEKIIVTIKKGGITETGENIYTIEKIIMCVEQTVKVEKERIYVYRAE